jgi:hypothetical protein
MEINKSPFGKKHGKLIHEGNLASKIFLVILWVELKPTTSSLLASKLEG